MERTWTREKADLGPGPWQHECDKIQWVDDDTGLDCLLVRNQFGAWCGYVGVPENHPAFGKQYGACLLGCSEDDDCYDHSVEHIASVHGGVTFADFCHEGPPETEARRVCHVAFEGRPERVFWFGFDCAHWQDLHPYPKVMDPAASMGIYQIVGPEGVRWSGHSTWDMPDDPTVYADARTTRVFGGDTGAVYRDMAFARAECARLAQELVLFTNPV